MHDFLNSLLSLALEVIGGIVVAVLPFLLLRGYVNRRDRHRWTQGEAECERQWTLQQQVRDLEQQIWEGQLSEEERERRRQARARAAEIRGEARRRLGLPEEA